MFRSIVWSTTDFPGQVTTTLFVGKCNWRCEYCNKSDLNKKRRISFRREILPKLLSRKLSSNHIVISGGELSVFGLRMIWVIRKLHKMGFVVGIHTNGSSPRFIKRVLPYVSFISVDMKTSWDGYKEHIIPGIFKHRAIGKVRESILLVVRSGKPYEIKTTYYPKYIDTKQLDELSMFLSGCGVSKLIPQVCKYKDRDDTYDYNINRLRAISNRNILTEIREI